MSDTASTSTQAPPRDSATTNITEPGRRRSRASLACQTCQQRKIKCDAQEVGIGVVCTPCRPLKTPCLVNRDGDRRRYASRNHIATLQARIQSLETLVRDGLQQKEGTVDESSPSATGPLHATVAPGYSPSVDSARLVVSTSETWTNDPTVLHAIEHQQQEQRQQQQLTRCRTPQQPTPPSNDDATREINTLLEPCTWPMRAARGCEGVTWPSPGPPQRGSPRPLSSQVPPPSSATAMRKTHFIDGPAVVTPPDDRVDDHGSYYGPTSQLHTKSPAEQTSSREQLDPARSEPGDAVITIDPDAPQLKAMLLRLYWKFQTLSVRVIHKQTFTTHRARGRRTQYYSNFLESALLACSARVSTSSVVRALSGEYERRAKADIVLELDRPTTASLQGFLLLSDYEMTQGRDRTGWLYCGIACRLIFDLGLHQERSDVARDREDGDSHPDLRRTLFLGCIVYEKLWSLYLGRPSSIPSTAPSSSLASTAQGGSVANPTLEEWINLCRPMSEITEILNSPQSSEAQSIDRLSELDGQLRTWYASLAPDIVCDDAQMADLDPGAYGLHMQFCRVQMLLHRLPTQASSLKRKADELESDDFRVLLRGWTQEQSLDAIYQNAVRIARLLLTYRQIWGVERIPSVMLDNIYTAATTLIAHITRQSQSGVQQASPSPQDKDVQWLRLLLHTLEALQVHFPITGRMVNTLAQISENTPLAGLFGPRAEQRLDSHVSTSCDFGTGAGYWGSFEAAMGDFVSDPTLCTMETSSDHLDRTWPHESDPSMLPWSFN